MDCQRKPDAGALRGARGRLPRSRVYRTIGLHLKRFPFAQSRTVAANRAFVSRLSSPLVSKGMAKAGCGQITIGYRCLRSVVSTKRNARRSPPPGLPSGSSAPHHYPTKRAPPHSATATVILGKADPISRLLTVPRGFAVGPRPDRQRSQRIRTLKSALPRNCRVRRECNHRIPVCGSDGKPRFPPCPTDSSGP